MIHTRFLRQRAALFLTGLLLPVLLHAQNEKDTTEIKKGWTFGALPAVAYDTDRGFKYGGLVNFFNYGDGSTYPDYLQSIYLEWSRTTKGSGINQLLFDTERLTPAFPVRLTVDVSYMIEKSQNFYGLNGYQSAYHPELEQEGSEPYISRMFYRYERNLFHFSALFQDNIQDGPFRWLAGIDLYQHRLDEFDFEGYNKGNDEKLKDTTTLFERYTNWGLIPADDADGGLVNYLRAGLIYDTRDQKANPMKGIWSEVLLSAAPRFMGNRENQYAKLAVIHRQYFPLIPDDLNLAVRLGYQGTILGRAPFYMQSYLISSYNQSVNVEGLGGQKSLRGILRNRIVGDDIIYSNVELRWKFWRFKLFKQQVYLALSGFWDSGKITDPIDFNRDELPASVDQDRYFDRQNDALHHSMGVGLHVALNRNFVVAVDYGRALNKQDGNDGVYIGMNFLY
ncbi:MAG: BamA/TamA family outer membrane protein [Bacteroidales bacterium]|nr:BamA/TamA family outer membrane protein [Bacteroidales bacterium]